MRITRPRKGRILEKAGLRYVACWLPANVADDLTDAIEEGRKIAENALMKAEEHK